MTDRKKPGMAFWATVAVVAVLAYPLSFGPVCWITSRTGVSSIAIPTIYRPMIAAMAGPEYPEARRMMAGLHGGRVYAYPPEGMLEAYSRLFSADGWRWRTWADFDWRHGRMEQLTEDVWEWSDASK
jgi:hypothetical protein